MAPAPAPAPGPRADGRRRLAPAVVCLTLLLGLASCASAAPDDDAPTPDATSGSTGTSPTERSTAGEASGGSTSVLAAPVAGAEGRPSQRSLDLVDQPRTRARAAGRATVFAHYFTPYPVSIDNQPPSRDYYARNYLTPDGEGGRHRAYGGLLRDRPLGRQPRPGRWELRDLRTEIRQAKAVGIDGFTLNILSFRGRTWASARLMMRAADRENFAIMPMFDASSISSSSRRSAAGFARLLSHRSAHTVRGQAVVSSFLAEAKSPTWWKRFLSQVERRHRDDVRFIAVFNNPSTENMTRFARFSWGLGSWGYRNAPGAAGAPSFADQAHALGARWMHPVAVQDARPRSGVYAEAGNTETLRTTWRRAIDDGADLVQIATWNDYSESTSIAPSVAHGWAFAELMGYYAEWFRRGSAPTLAGDHVVLTHRTHPWAARAGSGIAPLAPTLGGSTVAPRDTVEALVILSAPAQVTVTSGSNTRTVTRPAGMSSVIVPLGLGRPTVRIARGSTVVTALTSPYRVVDDPWVQDLQYVASGSSS
jgi:hypothetical protein